jgi:hypothetical protein
MTTITDSVSLFLKQRGYSPRTTESYLHWVRRLELHFTLTVIFHLYCPKMLRHSFNIYRRDGSALNLFVKQHRQSGSPFGKSFDEKIWPMLFQK